MAKIGQVLAFEQIVLFSLAVSIFIATYFIFNSYTSVYAEFAEYDQLEQIKETVANSILSLLLSTNSSSSIVVKIPKFAGQKPYFIALRENGLYVYVRNGRESFSNLYFMNKTYTFKKSTILSGRGKLIIYKTGNSIILK